MVFTKNISFSLFITFFNFRQFLDSASLTAYPAIALKIWLLALDELQKVVLFLNKLFL